MATSHTSNATGRLLVTGHAGFVGRHVLVEALRRSAWEIVGPGIDYDLRDVSSIDALVEATRPSAVLHLAGITFVPESVRDPENTLQVNVVGTLHLLQSLKRFGFAGPMVYVSSGDVYGLVKPDQLPVSELTPVEPRNPYAVSKVSAEYLCRQWALTENLPICVARPFNHIGAGQGAQFVVSKIAQQIALIGAGRAEPVLSLGDIDVSRDFLDVRDVVAAYFALLEQGRDGARIGAEVFNICSGQERTIRALVERMLTLSGVAADIVVDTALLRPSEQRRVAGNNQKLKQATGWSPRYELDETLRSILTDWNERTRDE